MGVENRSGFAIRWVATAGVPIFMVRNLGILKIVLFIPTLSDQYRTGPLEVSFASSAISSIGMPKTIKRTEAVVKSKDLFISRDFSLAKPRSPFKSELPLSLLICAFE